MSDSGNFIVKMKTFWGKVQPVLDKIGSVFGLVGLWIYRVRKIILAAPVLIMAIKLAADNMARLPETVGLNLQATGEFAQVVTREYAVYGPFAVTVFCLILMFCSRKVLLPWAVSIFTLVLPYLVWLTNIYPS